jgi:Heterokaryon incompatibility protein (HET)
MPALENERSAVIGSTSDNDQTFNIARTWIRNCSETHAYCNRSSPLPQNRFLPSRLIDIGTGPTITPRLCTTEALPVETKYLTLSHHWGDYKPPELTISNLEAFKDRIETSALPKSFKDAMQIASKLDIRYIWIDSLCIIQNSPQDWKEQTSMMGDIYHNSWCNIAATAALDARNGCFLQRTPLDVIPCRVEAKWNSRPKQTFICSSLNTWEAAVEHSALCHRAWVVQEIVLAPRVLHFGKQIFWECLELRACETYPNGLPNYKGTKTSLDIHSLRNELIRADSIKFKRYQLWAHFVNRYSACALSKPDKDKLVAISGLARKLIVDGDQYVAGLWKEILPYQLMWTVRSDPETESGNPYIPSWSWASMNKSILMRVPHRENGSSILIRALQTEVPLLGNDPFGQIKRGGLLRLEGPVVKTTIRRCIGIYNNKKWWLGTSLTNVFADRAPFADGTTVYCLSIEVNDSKGSKYGIILEPTRASPGQFYRRGYFAVFDLKDQDTYVRDFNEMHQSVLIPEEYEEALGVDSKTGFQYYRLSIV